MHKLIFPADVSSKCKRNERAKRAHSLLNNGMSDTLCVDLTTCTCNERFTPGMLNARVRGERMPHKISVMSDSVKKSFGVYS